MAIPLGKLTIIVGAGIVGSILAKEGRLSDFCSGAFKIVFNPIKQDDAPSSNSKPKNDSLLAQVNSLREELQHLASNRPLTIVTSSGSGGSSKYGVIIVVVGVGYGYCWWKGWKLPHMMFATRRGLSDACNTIAKQLETVYSSILATKRHLSSRIDRVDSNLDEFAELTAATKDEVSELRGDIKVVGVDVQYVHDAVQTLENKINRIEGKQDFTIDGVGMLMARTMEISKKMESIQATPSSSSRPALELPPMTPARTGSLPPALLLELPSPSASNESHKSPTTNGSQKVKRPLQSAVSAAGLKDLYGISEVVEEMSNRSPSESNGADVTRDKKSENSSFGLFGQRLPSFLTRTRSLMPSFK